MRQKLLQEGTKELSYEIREIVKKAYFVRDCGQEIFWENIGDPIQKHATLPAWMKEIVSNLVQDDQSYGYCHSKGILETREFLAALTNSLNGVQITAEDILFFNGLGDAIAKIYQYLIPSSRVIGPSPAYSTHSSAEAAKSQSHPLTYKLDPKNSWYPDFENLENQVKYNPNIVGILIINPDNPTGMVYPREILKKFVRLAQKYNLFLLSDEVYSNIYYNGEKAIRLAEIIEDVPGMSLRGISKEFPWPGSRCGWLEFYNREQDVQFNKMCRVLDDAKMIEVCSTTLPQMAIPKIMGDPRYLPYRQKKNEEIGKRSKQINAHLSGIPGLLVNETKGAFYNTIVFEKELLTATQTLPIENDAIKNLVEQWVSKPGIELDKRFVYYLLGATGIVVVPISSFCSELLGFRVTILEENEERLQHIFSTMKQAILDYTGQK
ncbi:MAG: pyridoxal phosphate-dependent aminotransferase [Fibrobacterales bacterium]